MSSINIDATRAGINELFEERKKFIIIGLTGRTGSGCTTTAQLLEKAWKDFRAPKELVFNSRLTLSSNEKRKYKILLDFAKENWKKFTVIKIKDVITSFIIENEFNDFSDYVRKLFSLENFDEIDQLKEDYDFYHREMNKWKKYFIDNLMSDDNDKSNEYLNGSRSLPRLWQRRVGAAGAPIGNGRCQVRPGRVAALPTGVNDAGQ